MNGDHLTPGILFSIDLLLVDQERAAANYLRSSCGISYAKDQATIDELHRADSIRVETVAFIKSEGLAQDVCYVCGEPADDADTEGRAICNQCVPV